MKSLSVVSVFVFLFACNFNYSFGQITRNDGANIPGIAIETGALGLAVRILPRGNFAVTRCAYDGDLFGVRVDYLDGRWVHFDDVLEREDLALSLKHCMEFNKKEIGLDPQAGGGNNIINHYKSTLSDYIKQPSVFRLYRKHNTDVLWFYMRYLHIESEAGKDLYYPLALIKSYENKFDEEVSARLAFEEEKEKAEEIQHAAMNMNNQQNEWDTEMVIRVLPTTAFGPDFNLKFTGGTARALAQYKFRIISQRLLENFWRDKYLHILRYAR